MELRDYIRLLRKAWILILAGGFVGGSLAAGYSALQAPSYQAFSKVFVSTQSNGTSQDLVQGNTFTVQRVKTYADLVLTPIVLLPIIKALALKETPEYLAQHVVATAGIDTSIINIAVIDNDPQHAAAIANSAAENLRVVVEAIEAPVGGIKQSSLVKLTLVQAATVPIVQLTPNPPLYLTLGIVIGSILGIVIAVAREVLDTRIRNESDVKEITNTAILGGIVFDTKASIRPLIVHADPSSPRAESFRALRTNLQYLDIGRANRSFVVSSAVQGEGKSTTTANLAIALADSGAKVLLVDSDLRRPRIADYMGIEGAVGLTDVLIGRAELRAVIQPWGKNSLSVLPAGHIPPNPSELLGSTVMHALIERFNQDFEVVLFDAPPLLPVTDAAILARNVGGVIMVVAASRTRKAQLRSALRVIQNVGVSVSGLVLTMVPVKGADAYGYAQYSDGGYGYGYGYGSSAGTNELPKPKSIFSREI